MHVRREATRVVIQAPLQDSQRNVQLISRQALSRVVTSHHASQRWVLAEDHSWHSLSFADVATGGMAADLAFGIGGPLPRVLGSMGHGDEQWGMLRFVRLCASPCDAGSISLHGSEVR
jgi:hypothetical protein